MVLEATAEENIGRQMMTHLVVSFRSSRLQRLCKSACVLQCTQSHSVRHSVSLVFSSREDLYCAEFEDSEGLSSIISRYLMHWELLAFAI